jgi:hypothetical protein
MEDPCVVHVAASGQKRDCTRSTSAGQIVDKAAKVLDKKRDCRKEHFCSTDYG